MSIDNNRPAYRILAVHGFFGPDDHLWPEGAELYFDGIPNEEMEPLNELARAKMVNYLEDLDNRGKIVSEKTGKAFAGRARTLDGQIELATQIQRDKMALMGAKKEVTSTAPLNASETEETGNANPKRGRGRPRKGEGVSAIVAA